MRSEGPSFDIADQAKVKSYAVKILHNYVESMSTELTAFS
jgi:hypothetical protein